MFPRTASKPVLLLQRERVCVKLGAACESGKCGNERDVGMVAFHMYILCEISEQMTQKGAF